MDVSSDGESTSQNFSDNINLENRDTRSASHKRLALNIVLFCILLENVAYEILTNNVVGSLHYNETLNWTGPYVSNAGYTFDGEFSEIHIA